MGDFMTNQQTAIPIVARSLSKRFGTVQAVAHVDLDVAAGSALGLLGPNGAGKSTTLGMLTGLIQPDAGSVQVFGHPAGSPQARALVGATPQATGFPLQVTPREIIAYTAARYGTKPQIDTLAERFGLGALLDRRVAGFSGGEMRRVALALAFVGKPKLVFLDEPTTGLDVEAQEGFRQIAREYVAQGGTLILTSHQWDEIEAVCDTISLIDKGETVLDGMIEGLRARTAINAVRFALPAGQLPPDWMQARSDGAYWTVQTGDSDDVLRRMAAQDVPFESLTIEPLKLKDLIARIRTQETRA